LKKLQLSEDNLTKLFGVYGLECPLPVKAKFSQ